MKKNYRGWVFFGFACCILTGLYACKKMNATYIDYIRSGEINYAGKPDSLKVYPGKRRVELRWLYNPRVNKAVIYWGNGKMQQEVAIGAAAADGWVRARLNDLNEGSYQFDVYTYDQKGARSIRVSSSGVVYGSGYEQSLVNRSIRSAAVSGSDVTISWYEADDGAAAVELTYKDHDGALHVITDPVTEPQTVLKNYLPGSEIAYRTLFVPGGMAIDTFYTNTATIIP